MSRDERKNGFRIDMNEKRDFIEMELPWKNVIDDHVFISRLDIQASIRYESLNYNNIFIQQRDCRQECNCDIKTIPQTYNINNNKRKSV